MSRQFPVSSAVRLGPSDDTLLSLRDPGQSGDAEAQLLRQLANQINNSVSVASANLAVVSETLEEEDASSPDVLEALSDARTAILRIASLAASLATFDR